MKQLWFLIALCISGLQFNSASAQNYKTYWELTPYDRQGQSCRLYTSHVFGRRYRYDEGVVVLVHERNERARIKLEAIFRKRDRIVFKDHKTDMTISFDNGSAYTFPVTVNSKSNLEKTEGYLPFGYLIQDLTSAKEISIQVPEVFGLRHHLKNTSKLVPRFFFCARNNGADNSFFANYNPRKGQEISGGAATSAQALSSRPDNISRQGASSTSAASSSPSSRALENEISALEKAIMELEKKSKGEPAVEGTRNGSFFVQIVARKNEAEARRAYDVLQKRYPGLMGDRTPKVLRSTLGRFGVWYRMGVGSFQQHGAAVAYCNKLKSAGMDCLVRRE